MGREGLAADVGTSTNGAGPYEPWFPTDGEGFCDPLVIVEEPEQATSKSDGVPVAAPFAYAPLDLDVFLAKPPSPPDWDWHGYYARGDLVLEAGDPGVGKSMNALARAVTAALGGGEHLGEHVASRRVLFVDLESPEDVVYSRLWAFGLRGTVDGFVYLHRPAGFNLLDSETLDRLCATIIEHQVEQIVIDSLRRAAPGLDENDSREVSTVLTSLREIAAQSRCTIKVIHHPRKPVGDVKIEALYAARGSGDLIGSVDSYLFYRKLSGGLIRLEHGKARRGREHNHVCYRITEDDHGQPLIEHVPIDDKPDDEELLATVAAYVHSHPGASTKDIEEGVAGSRSSIRKALETLSNPGDNPGDTQTIAQGPGRHPSGKYWYPANQAGSHSPGDTPATPGDTSPELSQGQVVALSPDPRRGGDNSGDTVDSHQTDRDLQWR